MLDVWMRDVSMLRALSGIIPVRTVTYDSSFTLCNVSLPVDAIKLCDFGQSDCQIRC